MYNTKMQCETRNCQNCKTNFTIEPDDFTFYGKMNVPPPTFCPPCRYQRRIMFRNERTFYRGTCAVCKKSVVSIYHEDQPCPVYCGDCWWSDVWDAADYAQDYDPNRSIFDQIKELEANVPHVSLLTDHATLVNSEYVNHVGQAKNCYLIFNADLCENVHYAQMAVHVKDALDLIAVGESELCYNIINCGKCFNVFFSEDCNDCHNIYFSKSLSGCSDCFGCINLRKQQYHIFNKPYSKEEYEKKLKEFKLDSYESVQKLKKDAHDFSITHPNKYMHELQNHNVSGDYVYNAKNAHGMFMARFVEDGKYCQNITMQPVKDVYDYSEWGEGAERIYETMTTGQGSSDVKFSWACWMQGTMHVEYSMFIRGSQNMFACVGMYKKKNSILNKQYSEEEYKVLREKIIRDMNEKPYVDSKGRTFPYGEFFPYDISLFAYNESTAPQHFPRTKEEIEERGWRWREPVRGSHAVALPPEKIPDSIHDISDDITKEVLECITCKRAFKIMKPEFDLLKRFRLPLHRKCPDCRHETRLRRINPPYLYHRKCQCTGQESENSTYTNTTKHTHHGEDHCPNEFETSYNPDQQEIVYCKECYQAEVV